MGHTNSELLSFPRKRESRPDFPAFRHFLNWYYRWMPVYTGMTNNSLRSPYLKTGTRGLIHNIAEHAGAGSDHV